MSSGTWCAACAVDAKHVSMPEEGIRDIDTALSVSFFIKTSKSFKLFIPVLTLLNILHPCRFQSAHVASAHLAERLGVVYLPD
jgi:hypothetical protein